MLYIHDIVRVCEDTHKALKTNRPDTMDRYQVKKQGFCIAEKAFRTI